MNQNLRKGLTKWAVSCVSLIAFYLIFGDIGILFALGLSFVVIKYL